MDKKRITFLVVLSILLLVIFFSTYSYALFESDITGNVETNVASWKIKINNDLVSEGQESEFVIDSINYTQTDSNVRSGKFAPGIEGYYDLIIDPTDTEVSIKYSIIIDDFETENLKVDRLELLSGGTLTAEGNTYTNIIPLNDHTPQTIRFYLIWTDLNTKESNIEDSKIGVRDNPDVKIPVTVNLIQYLGE